MRTASPGTRINGGAMRVRDALGNKIFHPYSDFLLHDIGTGDGIPVLPGAGFAATGVADSHGAAVGHCVRATGSCTTACRSPSRRPSRGTPTRARAAKNAYDALSQAQKDQVLAFLDSL